MTNATHCPACGDVNAIAAEACASCGEPLGAADIPVHPGETFRDPDDLSFADAPPRSALRAVTKAPEPATTTSSEPVMTPAQFVTRPHPAVTARAVPSDDDSEAAALRNVAESMARRRALAERGATGVVTATRPAHYAGFVIRFVAFAIDAVVLGAFTIPVSIAAIYGVEAGLAASQTNVGFLETREALGRVIAIAWVATAAIYFTVLHSDTGQTIGKAVVGIAVRRARDLAGIGVIRSFIRMLAYAVSTAFFFAGFLTILVSPRKRGWHDYLTGTCVVHLAPEEV